MATGSSHQSLAESGSTSFYTHTNVLSTGDQPSLNMASLVFPELQFRLPSADDAAALLRFFTDQRNVQFDKSCAGLDNASAISDLISQWRNITLPLERANIVVTIDGEVIGTGGLGWIGRRKSDGRLVGDAGIMLDADYRGKGYAYEALCVIIDHGFRVLGMEEIHLACVDANTAFKGLMSGKFGFEAKPIQDKMFGNEWIWRIKRENWVGTRHSDAGRENGDTRVGWSTESSSYDTVGASPPTLRNDGEMPIGSPPYGRLDLESRPPERATVWPESEELWK
jgi:RimJ/RimL family protein N-acetyltransferase